MTVFIKDVPRSLYTLETSSSSPLPLVLFGLFKHEHKYSVTHFNVQRNTEYTDSVRSKDPLVLCVGARRYRVNPIYSEHRTGKGNGVYKFHRYLRHGGMSVASIFAPIAFGRQSCSLLREGDDPQGRHRLSAELTSDLYLSTQNRNSLRLVCSRTQTQSESLPRELSLLGIRTKSIRRPRPSDTCSLTRVCIIKPHRLRLTNYMALHRGREVLLPCAAAH